MKINSIIALTFIVLLLSIPFILFAFQKNNVLLFETPNGTVISQENTLDSTKGDKHTTKLNKPDVNMYKQSKRYIGYSKESKSEESSNILARLGYKSIQEPLGARSLLMQNILPKQKRSKYMIPIAEPQ